jgi:serine/threonine protein kinase/tetratricopeptide (TPR) repeat protein
MFPSRPGTIPVVGLAGDNALARSLAMNAAADRHLLLGLLALQNGIINQGQLVAAFQAWTLDKSNSLADHLEARCDLNRAKRALLEALVEVHLDAHGGDVEKSLADVSAGKSTKESLARIGSPEINATLGHVGPAQRSTHDGDDSERTGTYSVGSATSDGQRFRVLRPHARGGLGAVFVALDSELNREVALKQILDDHADDPVSRQRFMTEAEITGGLEHPGIVPVYGMGTYDGGRPYYAMRFIRGDSLKEAVDRFHSDGAKKDDPGRRSLELRQLLRRFTDVCNAIEYAHSRGVLHRDLKPGNIIVGKHGETLVVDWGLAKAVGRIDPGFQSGERTLVPSSGSGSAATLPGSALGTPAYMSPEQAEGDLEHLGPRSDVYSLGSTLYCLLTGQPPFEGDVGEVLRAVQRGEFRPPQQLDATIDRAMEAVCLKAMATKPGDRYASPKALAEDVERWMADEPVSAWREPLSRRARRWGRRHRTSVTAAMAAMLMALAGTGAVLAVQTRANGELRRANANLAIANGKVTRTNDELHAANERERQRFDLAMEAIKLFHGEVSEDLLLKEKQFEGLRAKLLKGAAGFYGKLEGLLKGQGDAKSRAALGRAYFELGDLTRKIGNMAETLAVHRKALAVRRELAARPEADGGSVLDVAQSLMAVGVSLAETGDPAAELASHEEARDLIENLIATGRGSSEVQLALAQSLNSIGYDLAARSRPDEGVKLAHRALAITQELADTSPSESRFQSTLSSCHFAIGYLLAGMGRLDEAIAMYQKAVAIKQKQANANPSVSQLQDDLAKQNNNIANALGRAGRIAEAVVSLHRAVAIWQRAADDNPAVTSLQNNLAFGLNGIANLLVQKGRPIEAMEALTKARPILRKLADTDPSGFRSARNLALNYTHTGELLLQVGEIREAIAWFDQALVIHEHIAESFPGVSELQAGLAESLTNVGWSLWKGGRPAEALARYQRERTAWQRLLKAEAANPYYRDRLANCETNIAAACTKVGRLAEARACCDRAIAIRADLVKGQPTNESYYHGMAESLVRSGCVQHATGNAEGAAADWRSATALYASHLPPGGEEAHFRACCLASLAGLVGAKGSGVSGVEGTAAAEEAMAILRRAVAGGYRDIGLFRVESGLDSLRSRDDFRLLMMDLAMPAEPFAPPQSIP